MRDWNDFDSNPSTELWRVYIIGKTGMWKSALLENMIYTDILNGRWVAVIDPAAAISSKLILANIRNLEPMILYSLIQQIQGIDSI